MQYFLSGLAVAVAFASLLLSLAAFKVQQRRTNMELARSLHHDLTSGEVAKARESLGTITRDTTVAPSDRAERRTWYVRARTDYFTLLWCFERIWAGRKAIIADYRTGAASRPCRYLDNLIGWHVRNWAFDLPVIRQILNNELGSEPAEDDDGVLDRDSSMAFRKLSAEVLCEEDRKKLMWFLKEHGLNAVGVDASEQRASEQPLADKLDYRLGGDPG